jgi:hypothetical protein
LWRESHVRQDVPLDLDAEAISINSSPHAASRNTARSVMYNTSRPWSRANAPLKVMRSTRATSVLTAPGWGAQ